ncbi:hypothetical protein [Streptomyces sp. NPDC102437]|uniref:hypothetical protein n=1 Tax=Streptomyces sp. NPDC102437 TaxID=3366175 RepID=UPI00382831E4
MTTDDMGARIDAFLLQRFDPAWHDPTADQAAQCRARVEDAALELVRSISTREAHLRDLSPNIAETLALSNGETADWNLAMLRALRQIRTEAERLGNDLAADAGMHGANYPDLGAAWGITRQGARKRWPHAVSALNPDAYRGREPVTVNLFGGSARISFHPDDGGWWWIATAANGQTAEAPEGLTHDTSEEASAAAGAFLSANTATDGATA